MEKYFDIHVTYGEKDGDGYSIPIIANSEEEAKQKAIDENLFEYEDDVNDIDYIEEISKEDYKQMKEWFYQEGFVYDYYNIYRRRNKRDFN